MIWVEITLETVSTDILWQRSCHSFTVAQSMEVWFSIAYIEAISYREWDSNLFNLCIRGNPECQVGTIHAGFLKRIG